MSKDVVSSYFVPSATHYRENVSGFYRVTDKVEVWIYEEWVPCCVAFNLSEWLEDLKEIKTNNKAEK